MTYLNIFIIARKIKVKKIKLSAVVASALSLGVVCGGSVFAAKGEKETANQRIGRRITIYRQQDGPLGAKQFFESKKCERKETQLRRSSPIITVDENSEKQKDKKSDLIKTCVEQKKSLKKLIDSRLKHLSKRSKKWNIRVKSFFKNVGWEKFPSTADEFILKALENSAELLRNLASLEACSVVNGLKTEDRIFCDLEEICKLING